MATQLTQNFTVEDLTITNRASLQKENTELGLTHINQLTRMAKNLEVIRAVYPIIVTSSFRCPDLNAAVGHGNMLSQHLYGLRVGAADFIPTSHSLQEVFDWIKDSKVLTFHQLVMEYDSATKKQWIHYGMPAGYNDGQVFKLDPQTKEKIWIVRPVGVA